MASINLQYAHDDGSSWSDIEEDISSVSLSIILQIIKRDRHGRSKYGTTLDRTDLSKLDWAQHLQEELMDAVGYIECLKREIKNENSE